MIIHATRKLAQRLPEVSTDPLPDDSPLGSWHADRFTLDHRQCALFCHDKSRAALFVAGLRRPQFVDLGGSVFRQIFTDTLVALGCPNPQVRRAVMALGPCRFDTATDRSVLGSMRIVRLDLEAMLWDFPNVMMADPVAVSCRLTRRPAGIHGKTVWPQDRLRELVAGLAGSN